MEAVLVDVEDGISGRLFGIGRAGVVCVWLCLAGAGMLHWEGDTSVESREYDLPTQETPESS